MANSIYFYDSEPDIHVPTTLRNLVFASFVLNVFLSRLTFVRFCLNIVVFIICLLSKHEGHSSGQANKISRYSGALLSPHKQSNSPTTYNPTSTFWPSYCGFSLCTLCLWWKCTYGDAWKRRCSVRSGKICAENLFKRPLGCRSACGVKRSALGGFSTNCKTNVDIAELPD